MDEYMVLTQEEQDEVVVSFMLSQERDRYCHKLNIARYEEMLRTLPEGDWKKRIADLLRESRSRLNEVDSIIDATMVQLPGDARILAARQRIQAKER